MLPAIATVYKMTLNVGRKMNNCQPRYKSIKVKK